MPVRKYYDQALTDLRARVVEMGQLVQNQLALALQALELLDSHLGQHVFETDLKVNAFRFELEDECFKLISTQQPLARDLRNIVAVLNIIVDLERIGDKAKDLVETIPQVRKSSKYEHPSDVAEMGQAVSAMLQQCMQAYAENDLEVAKQIAEQEHDVDLLFANVLNQSIKRMAKSKKKMVTSAVGVLRAAQQLERIGDQVTNIAERIIYLDTGVVRELNVDPIVDTSDEKDVESEPETESETDQ